MKDVRDDNTFELLGEAGSELLQSQIPSHREVLLNIERRRINLNYAYRVLFAEAQALRALHAAEQKVSNSIKENRKQII